MSKKQNNNNDKPLTVYISNKLKSKPQYDNLKDNVLKYTELTGQSYTDYTKDLIKKDLENKIFTNTDIIKLEKAYYFNWQELLTNHKVKASTTAPINNINDYYIIKQVNNNLDKPNKEYKTYSFNLNNPFLHRGLYFYYMQPIADAPEIYYLIFEYNNKTKDLNLYIMDWIETKPQEAIIKEFPSLEASRYPHYITKEAINNAEKQSITEKTINDYNKFYVESAAHYETIIRPYEFILPYRCYDDYLIKNGELQGVLKEYQDLINQN